MEEKILEIVRSVLELEDDSELTMDAKLSELGINSIFFVMIVVQIEKTFGISVNDEWLICEDDVDLSYFVDMAKDNADAG